jgi:hypothetical protein
MARILAAVVIVAAILFALAAPSHAKGFGGEPASRVKLTKRIKDRISDKLTDLSMKHAGKIALVSTAATAGAMYAAKAAPGVPLKIAAGTIVLGTAYVAGKHLLESLIRMSPVR